MHKSRFFARTSARLRKKNCVVLGMMGLLFLDSASQAFAHGAAGSGSTGTAPSAHSIIDIGKSHGTVPLLPHGITRGSVNTSNKTQTTASVLNPGKPTAYTSELGQSGQSLNLDLTSTSANIILGTRLFNGAASVTITVGGAEETFKAGAHVTAGEYVAIQQLIGSGAQAVTLSKSGAARGGSFVLNAVDNSNVASLVIPSKVMAIDYFSSNQVVNLNGDLTNYGSIYAVSNNNKISSGTIFALNINNEAGAIISSVLPGALASAISGNSSTPVPKLNLSLDALYNVTNAGSISSSGALAISAGGNIVNALTSATNTGNPAPAIHAVNDLSLSAGSGQFTNAGLLSSANGNINISTPNASTNININARGGTFQALAGDINVRDSSYTGSSNISLSGGNYLSNNLNLYSGNGNIEGIVGQVSGNLNSTAGVEHLAASTANLQLGNNNVSGDPIFANDTGSISITGNNTFSGDLAIISSGNIVGSNASSEITDNGFNVSMIAGANITSINGLPPPSPLNITNIVGSPSSVIVVVTINGASAPGGFIDLSSNTTGTVIDTHATALGGNGGNVTLAAFAVGFNTGYVYLNNAPGNTINTAGNPGSTDAAGGNGGNVTIIAGGTDSSGIAVAGGAGVGTGTILTSAGSGSLVANSQSGSVSIITAQPITNSGALPGIATIVAPGDLAGGSTLTASTNLANNAGINIGKIITAGGGGSMSVTSSSGFFGANGGNVSIQATGNVTTGAIEAYGGGGGAGNFSAFGNGGNGGIGGSVSVSTTRFIGASVTITGDINTSGGGGGGASEIGGLGGNAGNILVSSSVSSQSFINSDALQISGPVLAAGGGSGGSGQAFFSGGTGGGSLGGGGGSVSTGQGDSASGGGGFFGGASGDNNGDGGGGGGAFGGGQTSTGGNIGVFGAGGAQGNSPGGTFGLTGQSFDISTSTGVANIPGANAFLAPNQLNGFARGSNGNVWLHGGTIAIPGTVTSAFALGSSAFSNDSTVAANVTYTAGNFNTIDDTVSGSFGAVSVGGSNEVSGASTMNFFGFQGTLVSTGSGVFNVGNLIFHGSSLAIISAGGITAGNIDLSLTGGGSGGSLTMIADANFSPSPNPAVVFPARDVFTTFGNFSASGNSGNISAGNVTTYSTTSGNGGNVVAVAYDGSASFGSIDTHSATGAGGSVQIISQGATTGDINTTGPRPGNILIASALPVALTGTNLASGSLTGGFTPGTTQNGAIIAGNLSAGGGSGGPTAGLAGSVNIITGGAVTLTSVNTAGAGGFTAFQTNASNGANGGNITINAGGNVLISNNLDAFGGGGGGGAGGFTTTGAFLPVNGSQGGAGGTGGAILVETTAGTITIGGEVNSSGGGGGGGGGGSGAQVGPTSGGSGGAGGVAAPVTLDAPGNLAVSGPIYATDGAAGGPGGSGGLSEAQSGGGGGGGGGSYGGGGGGGGGGSFLASASGAGGGGGAGAFGGGGGYGASFGGIGGGFALAPAGTPGANGGAGFGGNGTSVSPSGGLGGTAIGAGGTGGSAFADAASGNNGAGGLIFGGTTGFVSIAGSNVTTNNVVIADQITMSAQPGSNGSISFLGALTATMVSQNQGISLSSDGTGGISSSNNSPIASFVLLLDPANGSAGTISQPLVYSPFPSGNNGANHFIIPTDSNAVSGSMYITTSVRNVRVLGSVGIFNLTASDPFAVVIAGAALNSNNITIDASGANGVIQGNMQAANTSSNNGGKITLTASAITPPFGSLSPVIVSANSASGKGGVVGIDITATGTTTTLGTGALQLELSATGTSGGSVSLTTPGTLAIVTNAGGIPSAINVAPSSGAGGSITFSAAALSWGLTGTGNGTPLVLNASSFNSGAGGAGGSITMTQTSNTAVLLGTANGQLSLQAIGTSGGSVSYKTAGLLEIFTDGSGNPQGINVAPTPASGAGGSITLNANTFSWGTSGTNSSTSTLVLNADGAINGSAGAGGSISVTQTSSAPLVLGSNNGQIILVATGTSGGSVSFSTAGSLGIVTNGAGVQQAINVAPTSANGGSLNLTANAFTWGTATGTGNTTDLLLNGDGFSSGSAGLGGFIELNQTSSSSLNVGTGVGQISFSAKGGNNASLATGSGVAISSGGNLVVTPSGITITPSSSNVGENVTLQSNSTTAFNYGLSAATNKNGVLGSISVAGSSGNGNLSLINLGGALTNSAAITAVNNLTMSAGGTGAVTVAANIGSTTTSSILLSTLGTGNVSATKTISAGTLNLFSQGGSIGGASPLAFAAPNVNVGAPAGVINLNDTTSNTSGTALLKVGAFGGQDNLNGTVLLPAQTVVIAGGAVTLSTATSLDTTANINASTNSTLVSTNITLTSSGTAAGTGINLGGSINASTPMSTGGAVSITAAGSAGINQTSSDDISGVKSVTLTESKGNVVVGSVGQTTEPGTVNLTGINISTNGIKSISSITEKATGITGVLGNISLLAGAIDATSASAGVVSLTAGPGGITAATGTDISGGKSVTLLAATGSINVASIGNSPTGIVQLTALNSVVSTAKLSGSAVTLRQTGASGTGIAVNNISANGGAIALTAVSKIVSTGSIAGSSVTLSQTALTGSGITVNNIATTNGAISVTAAGNLNVDAGASITTGATTSKTSTITLEDSNTTNGNITINAGDQISTTAINGGNGNVNITIGPVPATPTIVDAPAGAGISYNPAQPSAAPFAYFINTSGVTFASSASSPISFNVVGKGQIIVNNASKGSGLITINGGTGSSSPTKITADPLVGSALGSTLAPAQAKTIAVNVPALTNESQGNSILKIADSASGASQSYELSLSSEPFSSDALSSGSLSTLTHSGMSAFSGSAQSSIIEETISASNHTNPINRTLYGAATEYNEPEDSLFIGGGAQTGEIEAVLLTGADLGIKGPSQINSVDMDEMAGSASRVMKLRRGNIIVAYDHDTVVETSFGDVKVGARAMVLVMALPTGTAVFNLDDNCKNSVTISIGQKQMALAPGRQAMITLQLADEFEMVNPAELFAYRNVMSTNLEGGLKMFSSEFLLPSAIAGIKPLRALRNSLHPEAKRLSEHLLKTVASVWQLNRQQDQFQQYLHPRLTAEALIK